MHILSDHLFLTDIYILQRLLYEKVEKALNNKKEIKFEILIVQKIFSYLHLPVNGIFVYKDGFCYLNPIFILDIH